MRITHQMLTRNYLNRMNTNLSNLTKSNEKLSSQRAYNKSYENVTDAGKALRVRKLITDNERYQTTIRDVKGRAEAAENALRTVTGRLQDVEDRVVQGLNGTYSPEDRQKIADELEQIQNEVYQVMNNTFSNNFLFSAAGNADGSAPFKTEDGRLQYNGVDVDSMTKNTLSGKIQDADGNPLQYNTKNYVDIGFGYRLGANDRIDANTAFLDTYSGVESFGFGMNGKGVPVNAYSLLGDMVENLRNDNMDRLGEDLNQIPKTMEAMLVSITEIGARTVTLDNTLARLEEEYITLADSQKELEAVDLSEEIIYNKDFDMSWMVTLQLGSRILPQTIFDFIR